GTEQRRRRTERVAGDRPQQLQSGRAHAALGHQRVEGLQVIVLLVCHRADFARMRRAVPHYGELPGVDPGGAVLAGLVDADHGCTVGHPLRALASSRRIATADITQMIALNPASEMPPSVHGATSQRISGAFMIASSGSPPLLPTGFVQGVMPGHQPYSTPA